MGGTRGRDLAPRMPLPLSGLLSPGALKEIFNMELTP